MKKIPRLTKTLFFAGAAALAVCAGTTPAFALDPTGDTYYSKQWQWDPERNGINIEGAWLNGYTGKGVVIGIVDYWLDYSHPDLAGNYSSEYSYDFVGTYDGDDPSEAYSGETHGTFVAGMAAAVGGNGIGVTGAAPEATLAGLHVDLSDEEILQAYLYLSGIDESGNYTEDATIRIKNCSFGDGLAAFSSVYNVNSAETVTVLDAATRNNVIFVYAAGNDRKTSLADANGAGTSGYEGGIVVGATSKNGVYSTFSDYGANLFVCAPGTAVYSTTRGTIESEDTDEETEEDAGDSSSLYSSSSGTSFAAPVVSGVIALAAASNVAMDTRWAKWAFAATSDKLDTMSDSVWTTNSGGYHFSNDYGFGLVNAVSFVNYATSIAYETIRQTTSMDSSGGTGTLGVAGEEGSGVLVQSFNTSSASTFVGEKSVESVELTVNVSGINYFKDLKISIVSPSGTESVVLDTSKLSNEDVELLWAECQSAGYVDENGTLSWTFTSNAFWGAETSAEDGTWSVRFENLGNSEGTVSASTLVVNTGSIAFDTSNLTLSKGDKLNIHALCWDTSSTSYTIESGASLYVEDSIIMNAGTLNVSGQVATYDSDWKGVKIYINGGTINIDDGGVVEADRGTLVSAGTLNVNGGATLSGALDISGGTVFISGTKKSPANVSGTITMTGGTLYTNSSYADGEVVGSSVAMTGGRFIVAGKNDFSVSVNGGVFTVNDGVTATVTGVTVGATSSTYGTLNVGSDATLNLNSDLTIRGNYTAREVDEETGETTTEESVQYARATIAGTISGAAFSMGNSIVTFESGATFKKSVDVAAGGILTIAGDVAITNDLTIHGTYTTSGIESAVVYGPAYGTISANSVQLNANGVFYVGGVGVGTTMIKALDDVGFQSAGGSTIEITPGDVLAVNKNVVLSEGTVVSITLQDILPTKEISFISLTGGVSSKLTVEEGVEVKISGLSETPTVWHDGEEMELAYEINTETGTLEVVEGIDPEDRLRLTYDSFTHEQHAIVNALRTVLEDGSNANKGYEYDSNGVSLRDEINKLETLTELEHAYDKFLPTNLVTINDLHNKQAAAVTGMISRRSRELRNGAPVSDLWSAPLFGRYGFSFSANPNLVADAGFRQLATYNNDDNWMVWANGGYSFSNSHSRAHTDKTKNEMRSVAIGIDYAVMDELSIGIFADYLDGSADMKSSGSDTDASLRGIGLYVMGSKNNDVGSFFYTGMVSYGYVDYDFSRKVRIGDYSSTASASPDGSQLVGYLEVGYEWDAGSHALSYQWTTGPTASLRYAYNDIESYTEHASSAINELRVNDFNYNSLVASIGWRATLRFDIQELMTIVPEARVSWQYEILDRSEKINSDFIVAPGNSFSTTMNRDGNNYLTAGVGVTILALNSLTVSFDYDINVLRDHASPEHNFNLMVRCRF